MRPEPSLLVALGAACGPTGTGEAETAMQHHVSNPYTLANEAFAAWSARDFAAAARLVGREVTRDELDAAGLGADDRVRGLYFTASRSPDISAVIRQAEGDRPAVWFHLRRSGGSFVLVGLEQGPTDPPMTYDVEG